MSIDTNTLRKAIRDFQFHSKPHNSDQNAACTIKDINNVIERITKLMTTFVNEIEKSQ